MTIKKTEISAQHKFFTPICACIVVGIVSVLQSAVVGGSVAGGVVGPL
jgi:hypothetical protein